ncbi:MAG: hypothetical protein MUF15_08920 [Acidobacteria bacterium]|jgi:hypothetical protein|nr:hypothetical protein [Acidobacteriota bacterium]
MDIDRYKSIVSEIRLLEEILVELPEEEVIERLGFEHRLAEAKKQIANMRPESIRHKAVVTFRGEPVIGTHGIAADFAAKAAGAFTDAIAAVAAGLAENLRYMGPIPHREQNRLLITGTAIGSFGFEFEVPNTRVDNLLPEKSTAEAALQKMQLLFRLTAEGNDDRLTELVEEIHPRAVRKAVEFLQVLRERKAWCAFSFQQHSFRFDGKEQVGAVIERLSEGNIHESDKNFPGELQGVLPKSRTFEFKCTEGILSGKIGPDIEDADVLNRDYLHKPSQITLHIIQVGQGRPRYVLENLEHIHLQTKTG